MGGVKAYQQASALNTSLFSTSRWVVQRMRAHGLLGDGCATPEPSILEVGAVNTQLLDTPGICTRAIDLHSTSPRIEQVDFFSLPHGGELDVASGVSRTYDVVVCSMVLNCVPDARRRFEMLIGLRAQLRKGGLCFVIIPRTCLTHSYAVTEETFVDCLRAVGLTPVKIPAVQISARSCRSPAKLAFFECVAASPDMLAANRYQQARHQLRSQNRPRSQRRGAKASISMLISEGISASVPACRGRMRTPMHRSAEHNASSSSYGLSLFANVPRRTSGLLKLLGQRWVWAYRAQPSSWPSIDK